MSTLCKLLVQKLTLFLSPRASTAARRLTAWLESNECSTVSVVVSVLRLLVRIVGCVAKQDWVTVYYLAVNENLRPVLIDRLFTATVAWCVDFYSRSARVLSGQS